MVTLVVNLTFLSLNKSPIALYIYPCYALHLMPWKYNLGDESINSSSNHVDRGTNAVGTIHFSLSQLTYFVSTRKKDISVLIY